MPKLKTILLACAAAFAIPTTASADGGGAKKTAPASLTDAERTEVNHRHHINQMEIDMGKLAAKKGTAAVKKYGSMLVADHTKADTKVKALAKAKGVTLTAHPAAGDDAEAHEKNMELMKRLETLSGTAFDEAYLAAMVDGHDQEIARVSAALPMVSDKQVRALLDETLPSLRKHSDAAKALQGKATAQGPGEPTPPSAKPTPPPTKPAPPPKY